MEESTIRQRLGGRRDSNLQIGNSPPSSPPPLTGNQRRRRSSLAQLTDILKEWSGTGSKRNSKAPLNRRETLADIARTLPWQRANTEMSTQCIVNCHAPPLSKRRESSAESGLKNMRSRRESHGNVELTKLWKRRDQNNEREREETQNAILYGNSSTDTTRNNNTRRDSGDSSTYRSSRRDSQVGMSSTSTPPPPKVIAATRKRRDSLAAPDMPNFRQEQRPSTSSTASDSGPNLFPTHSDSACQALPPPTIIMSSVTPPATSPTVPPKGRRDSTTQCGRANRRDSRSSPERGQRLSRLQRQATAYDECCLPPTAASRRDSQPALTPDGEERQARRDSLSPDSASKYIKHYYDD